MAKRRKKYPPNPLPCGCVAMGVLDLENAVETGYNLRVGYRDVHIVHCPLHAAAPDLLAACKAVIAAAGRSVTEERFGEAVTDELDTINAAIAKATKQTA